jgi:hypothetical protein
LRRFGCLELWQGDRVVGTAVAVGSASAASADAAATAEPHRRSERGEGCFLFAPFPYTQQYNPHPCRSRQANFYKDGRGASLSPAKPFARPLGASAPAQRVRGLRRRVQGGRGVGMLARRRGCGRRAGLRRARRWRARTRRDPPRPSPRGPSQSWSYRACPRSSSARARRARACQGPRYRRGSSTAGSTQTRLRAR